MFIRIATQLYFPILRSRKDSERNEHMYKNRSIIIVVRKHIHNGTYTHGLSKRIHKCKKKRFKLLFVTTKFN